MDDISENEGLKYINEQLVMIPTKCKCCEETYIFEKMFYIKRFNMKMAMRKWHYCKKCAPQKEDVLRLTKEKEHEYNITIMDHIAAYFK